MIKEKKDWQESLKLAQANLDKTNQETHPKLYQARNELANTLQYNENMRIRAEKAEKELKALKEQPKEKETPKNSEFSPKDYLALSQTGVPADDLDEVSDYAKFKGISIAEALKTSYVKIILKERKEERETAAAANTGGGKRGTSKISPEALLDKLNKGELLEEDIEKAAKARMEMKKQHKT